MNSEMEKISIILDEIKLECSGELPLHSAFWVVEAREAHSKRRYVSSLVFHTSKKIVGRTYKPVNNLFKLNKACHEE